MFVAFIDFAKAFDSVHHQLLWMKLSALGFSTRMLKILQNMYSNASSVASNDGRLHLYLFPMQNRCETRLPTKSNIIQLIHQRSGISNFV